ncbi:MAG TPA: hydroxymethylbilane synthase [Burkholderiaceae bacterium]|nr:hydroxymethylbilane synthase [Burkholderiaceae bacterium]
MSEHPNPEPAAVPALPRIVIATRQSPLAMWQAEHVRELLRAAHPGLEVDLLPMTTRGDQVLDRALAKVGGKGLFVKELELALVEGRAHLAVHSLKDVPMQLDERFALAAILAREDPRDCFVSGRYARLADLPAGACVGTSSLRRELALRATYPHLRIEPVRGNLGTRLAKLDAGHFDALVLAAAGVKRLGLASRIREILPTSEFLPAPGQGALAIETLASQPAVVRLVAVLEDPATRAAATAERAVSRGLGGSCEVPLAAYAEVDGNSMSLRAWAGDARRGVRVDGAASGPIAMAESLGVDVVAQMRERGVERLLGA